MMEKDDSLARYFENKVWRHQSLVLDLRRSNFKKNHENRITLVLNADQKIPTITEFYECLSYRDNF
jgi:hypothetical protein